MARVLLFYVLRRWRVGIHPERKIKQELKEEPASLSQIFSTDSYMLA